MVADLNARGQEAYALPVFEGNPESWASLNYQVEHIAATIEGIVSADPDTYADGYHLVCHSQGGLTCRCLTEYMSDHNIDTLVSMAGPQLGVYDEAFFSFFKHVSLQDLTLEEIYHVAYNSLAQMTLSVANMWNDPNHQDEFQSSDTFLPKYNEANDEHKANFLRYATRDDAPPPLWCPRFQPNFYCCAASVVPSLIYPTSRRLCGALAYDHNLSPPLWCPLLKNNISLLCLPPPLQLEQGRLCCWRHRQQLRRRHRAVAVRALRVP
jgi:hypothetical protein